ncbi:MAG: hypothetical protein IKD80_03645 [Selenomonadaceae bacterium]|nr:hypothetical protein [Selenomonadaceae bacterium]
MKLTLCIESTFLSAAKENLTLTSSRSPKESRAAYENVTFSNGGDHGRTSMCGLKLYR